jgi:uncharacterized protein YbjT (DUF2867 family)
MNEKQMMTLVLSGNGKTGRRVAERLIKRGIRVRIGSRAGHPPFDWEQPSTWEPALRDVRQVYVAYQPDLAFPGAVETVTAFTRLAIDGGVRRLVLLSGRNEPGAAAGEQVVQASGAEWTIVRSSTFAQNFGEGFFLEAIRAGELAFPAGNVAEPFIDVEDIADIAAEALSHGLHAGRLYEVTGPRLLTFAEAVGEIGRATGRDLRYVPITSADFLQSLTEHGVPVEFAAPLTDLFATIYDGRNTSLTDGVQQALGRTPRDFTDYVRRTAAGGVWRGAVRA